MGRNTSLGSPAEHEIDENGSSARRTQKYYNLLFLCRLDECVFISMLLQKTSYDDSELKTY